MKKIIIVAPYLRIGGVERALLGLLNALDYNRYDVDLFMWIHDGEFLPLLSSRVNLLPEIKKYNAPLISLKECFTRGYILLSASKIIAHFFHRLFCLIKRIKQGNEMILFNYIHKYMLHFLPQINTTEYDLAISFSMPHYIASHKVIAKKRIAWIHTDYSFFDFDKKAEVAMWNKYDYIASISDSATAAFVKQFPTLKNKIVTIENILSPDFVRQQAGINDVSAEMPKVQGVVNICSVGRFSEAKNFDNVPFICKRLHELGCKVKWYIIGFGGDEALIRSKIAEAAMQEHVIILGKKENPYPYMAACDIYAQPSRYEGKAVTVREAQILCKPVVITDFATSASQLRNGFDGVIVAMDNEGCANGIKSLIDDRVLQKRLIENCRNSDFGNSGEVEKIYEMMG